MADSKQRRFYVRPRGFSNEDALNAAQALSEALNGRRASEAVLTDARQAVEDSGSQQTDGATE